MSSDNELRYSELLRDSRPTGRELQIARTVEERQVDSLHERTTLRIDPDPFELVDLSAGGDSSGGRRRIVDIRQDVMRVTVELGRIRLPRERLASFDAGDVVSMDQDANQSVSILANGIVVARGDLVSVNGRVAVRITERLEESAVAARRKAA